MKNIITKFIFLTILIIWNVYPQSGSPFQSVINSISSDIIKKHLEVLADDSLSGRAVGTYGAIRSAEYIASQFSNFGLNKISAQSTFFQDVPMHGSISLSSSKLIIISEKDTTNLSFAKDYFLYKSGQQTFFPVALSLVFVGYGIIAPEFDYNDYQSVDVENKIVVYFDGEPESNDTDYFDAELPTIYSNQESKRRIALSRGAAGTILIPYNNYKNWDDISREFWNEDVSLAYSVTGNLNTIINPVIAEKLFLNSGFPFDEVIKMHKENRIKSFPLNRKIKFRGAFKERDFIAQNVIGLITGRDEELKSSFLIISSHYDHLGIGLPVGGDSVYNGALDNAIGVAVFLELARSFSELQIKPKRSILFIATTGEEKGLLGSNYYIDHPVVPLYRSIANVNVDGIAMFKDFESIIGIGSEYSSLETDLRQTAKKFNLSVQEIPDEFRKTGEFTGSDQFAFAMAGIPSILISEGTKNKTKSEQEILEAFIDYYLNKYHTPFDDLNQNINYDAAVKHAKIIFDFCYNLADSSIEPQWHKGINFINARLRSIAERR